MIESRTNHALEQAGCDSRVDRRSLAEQHRAALVAGDHPRAADLDRPATLHEGPRVTQIRREAARAGRAPLGGLDRAAVNDDIHQLVAERAELARVSAQILDFEAARLVRDRADAFLAGVPRPAAASLEQTLAQGLEAARAQRDEHRRAQQQLKEQQAYEQQRRSAEIEQQQNEARRLQRYYAEERQRLEAEQKAAAQPKWRPPSPG